MKHAVPCGPRGAWLVPAGPERTEEPPPPRPAVLTCARASRRAPYTAEDLAPEAFTRGAAVADRSLVAAASGTRAGRALRLDAERRFPAAG